MVLNSTANYRTHVNENIHRRQCFKTIFVCVVLRSDFDLLYLDARYTLSDSNF